MLKNVNCNINLNLNFEMSQQKPDHPHQAAVHLMKALKCCKQCSQSEQIDLLQVQQLQYRKNMLVEQLRQIGIRGQSVQALQSQIRQLDELIAKLQEENMKCENQGLKRVEMAAEERHLFQNQEMAQIMTEMQIQIQENKRLKMEMQSLMERVKYLNRVNNELVFNFTNL